MSTPEESVPTVPIKIDHEAYQKAFDQYRAAYSAFLGHSKIALDMGGDANKFIAAFYERIMLVDLGTIGLSITALTTLSNKFSYPGFHRYTTITMLSVAWLMLLVSSFLCRTVMLQCIAANKEMLAQWRKVTSEYNRQEIRTAAQSMSKTVSGTLVIDGIAVNASALLTGFAEMLDPKTVDMRMKELQDAIAKEGAPQPIATNTEANTAIKLMHFGMLLLGIVAVFLFATIR